MKIKSATPYLILGGKARAAIALYERALGARTEELRRFGDMDDSCPEARKEDVMHAALRVGEALLMLSDGPDNPRPTSGGTVSVALDFQDGDEMRRSFDALAADGHVIQPIFDAPWGDLFGVVTDAFGVNWMFTSPK